jgi:hypothetical protein
MEEAKADDSKPLPHWFEMAGWTVGQSLGDYLAAELKRVHKEKLNETVCQRLLESGRVLPLLDGLDELGDLKRIQAGMVAINEFLNDYGHRNAVVCCRIRDYALAQRQLTVLNGAVQLQPLTEQQIQDYLGQWGKLGLWEQIQSVPEMRRLLYPESPDDEPGLLRVPLFISLAAQSYDPKNIFYGKKQLLENYIDYQLRDEPAPEQTIQTLTWLAKIQQEIVFESFEAKFLTHNILNNAAFRREFYRYFGYRPPKVNWLKGTAQEKEYIRLISTTTLGITFATLVIYPELVSSIIQAYLSSFAGLSIGVLVIILPFASINSALKYLSIVDLHDLLTCIAKFTAKFGSRIFKFFSIFTDKTTDSIYVFTMICIPGISNILIYCLLWRFLKTPVVNLYQTASEYKPAIFVGLTGGLIVGLLAMPFYWWEVQGGFPNAKTDNINEIVYSSDDSRPRRKDFNIENLFNFLLTLQIVYVVGVIAVGHQPQVAQSQSALLGNTPLLFYMLFWMIDFHSTLHLCGWIENLPVRYVLHRRFQLVPWRLDHFLSYAADRRLLQQTGGSYRFIHRSLLEHFARMD